MSAFDDITRLLNEYCYRIDTGDLARFPALFTEDAVWGIEGSSMNVGRTGAKRVMDSIILYDDGTPRTRHTTSNVQLDIDESAGTASGQCYITVFQQTPDMPLQPVFSGHYFDAFRRDGGVWYFSQRLIRYPLFGDLSAHLRQS